MVVTLMYYSGDINKGQLAQRSLNFTASRIPYVARSLKKKKRRVRYETETATPTFN